MVSKAIPMVVLHKESVVYNWSRAKSWSMLYYCDATSDPCQSISEYQDRNDQYHWEGQLPQPRCTVVETGGLSQEFGIHYIRKLSTEQFSSGRCGTDGESGIDGLVVRVHRVCTGLSRYYWTSCRMLEVQKRSSHVITV